MFCLCCRPPGGFFAEGVAEPVLDFARALKRRAAYERRTSYSKGPVTHPPQTEFIIRNVSAMTMDPDIGDPGRTDLHVRGGVIAAISGDLPANSAIEIDGTGLRALPGLIASHHHPLGDISGAVDLPGARLDRAEPADIYRALRLAYLDLTSAGFTALHICGANLSAAQAETAVLAQIDSGMGGRFSYPMQADATGDPKKAVRELYETWFAEPKEHLLELGLIGEGSAFRDLLAPHQLPVATAHAPPPNEAPTISALTIEAARQLGADQWIGSLTPGKRADLILVRGEPVQIPAPEAVELVVIDGQIRKRNGVLTEPNEGLIRREGTEANAWLRGRAEFHHMIELRG